MNFVETFSDTLSNFNRVRLRTVSRKRISFGVYFLSLCVSGSDFAVVAGSAGGGAV